MSNVGTYIASRVSHAARWRDLRDVDGYKITSSWIDEAGPGESKNLTLLWRRIQFEIENSERLILYVEPDDFPLKGALVEVGIAIGYSIPIRVIAPRVDIDPISFRPLGSWVNHDMVTFANTIEGALAGATVSM